MNLTLKKPDTTTHAESLVEEEEAEEEVELELDAHQLMLMQFLWVWNAARTEPAMEVRKFGGLASLLMQRTEMVVD